MVVALTKFQQPDVHAQVNALIAKLRAPASGLTGVAYSDLSGVDVAELITRGARRIRPASNQGEELRDVVLWMTAMDYAKQSGAEMTFISGDKNFREPNGSSLHPQLCSDLARFGVCVKFYADLAKFITENSLQTEDIIESWLFGLVDKLRIEEEAKRKLKGFTIWGGTVSALELDSLHLATGKRYKVDEDSHYAELLFSGTARLIVTGDRWVQDQQQVEPLGRL
jgi:hypothetical protein